MSGMPMRTSEHITRSFFDDAPIRQQCRRIEISLHSTLPAQPVPSLVEVHTPVQANDVSTSFAHEFQQTRRSSSEIDHRHAARPQPLNQLFAMWQDKLLEVFRGQAAYPTVEYLYDVSPGMNLIHSVMRKDRNQLAHELSPHLRGAVHQLLGFEVVS